MNHRPLSPLLAATAFIITGRFLLGAAAFLYHLRAVTLLLDIISGYLDTITVVKLGNVNLTTILFHSVHLPSICFETPI